MATVLPHDCSHERVDPRGGISSFAVWERVPQNFREWDAGWCERCGHFVRREPGIGDWQAFKPGPEAPF
jgi:hypothetical protein